MQGESLAFTLALAGLSQTCGRGQSQTKPSGGDGARSQVTGGTCYVGVAVFLSRWKKSFLCSLVFGIPVMGLMIDQTLSYKIRINVFLKQCVNFSYTKKILKKL